MSSPATPAPTPEQIKFRKIASGSAGVGVLIAAFAVPALTQSPYVGWLWCAFLLLGFCALIGLAISGRLAGLIIDNRNRVSLSKFQAAAWSIVVLSALIAAVFGRINHAMSDPAAIDLPNQLLAVMGISATSLVAAPVILSLKAAETPTPGQAAATATKLGDTVEGLADAGKVYARDDPSGAQWLDMFRGEEVSNAASPDLSKLQQFLITIVVLAIYCAALRDMFTSPYIRDSTGSWLSTLPKLSEHLAWLVGISHAGYLAYKAAPHGSSADQPPTTVASSNDGSVG